LARGSTSTSDTGFQQGTLTFTAGNLVVSTLNDAIQRAANTAIEMGSVNVNGTATLISTNIVLAQSASGANASLVTGSLNVTNGTVEGNVVAGGGNSLINLNGGALIVSNFAGTAAARISSLNLLNSTMHLAINGSAPAANVNVAAISATGATIVIDSVANVTGPTVIHLINYTGSDPFAGLSLALPLGYTGSLVDNAGSVDLSINVGAIVPPGIHSINLAAGQIIISGSNNTGAAGGTYHLLSSTNLLVPLSNWVIVSGGSFDSFGNFSTTNGATNSQQFFILKEP
jgi:hypothetical protein